MVYFKKLLQLSLLAFFLFGPIKAFSQSPLEGYLREGLENNLALRQKNIGIEQALYSLKIANSYLLPSVSLGSGYTHGNGGRSISLPIGDMLNPVYATLNQLTESRNFPRIENVEQSFFPSNFLDAHLRTAVPLVNTNLYYNKKISEDQVLLKEYEVKVLERELVKTISMAYYNYLSAVEAVKVYSSALELVKRNLQVNQSLLKNGKGLPASVLRAESEYESVKAQLQDARNSALNAQRYFNFLLNKPQDSPIEVQENIEAELDAVPHVLAEPTSGVEKREELQMLQTRERLSTTVVRMNQQFWVPQLNAFLDLGAQAENWNWNERSRYFLLGVSLDMPLFSGFRYNYQSRQAQLGAKEARLSMEEGSKQLQLMADNSRNNMATAWHNYGAAKQRLQASESYYRLIERGYSEGSYSLIEFIDARNQLTSAQLQKNIQVYQVLSSLAQYERETSAYSINH